MLFNSLSFAVLLTCVFIAFSYARQQHRWAVLLAGSIVFYAGLKAPHLLLALALVTCTAYFCALGIERSENEKRKQLLFWSGCTAIALVLLYMRYIPFLTTNLNTTLGWLGVDLSLPVMHPLVAIGVSFYVFQAISYLSDVYLEMLEPETHFGRFALYMSFFPKLLQGPIERGGDLLPQLRTGTVVSSRALRAGLFLFAIGLFKKVVIADRLAALVDPVFMDVHSFTGLPLMAATYAYAFQIYFDFSGYTDMALGAAALFGIELTDNFRAPYLATSIPDFWRRWHITFSRWILDYVFKPLQLSWRQLRGWSTPLALLVTFFVCGVWHGASWHFIIWGLLHGVYMIVSVLATPHVRKLYRGLKLEKTRVLHVWQVVMTFNLVCLAWILFRATSMGDAAYVLTHLLSGVGGQVNTALAQGSVPGIVKTLCWTCLPSRNAALGLGIALAGGLLLGGVQIWRRRAILGRVLFEQPAVIRWAVYYAIVLFMLAFGSWEPSQYVYFEF